MASVVERAPNGWKALREVVADDPEDLGFEPLSASETVEVDADYRKQAWARLLAKVYEIDPLVCPKCGDYTSYCTSLIRSLTLTTKAWFLLPLCLLSCRFEINFFPSNSYKYEFLLLNR